MSFKVHKAQDPKQPVSSHLEFNSHLNNESKHDNNFESLNKNLEEKEVSSSAEKEDTSLYIKTHINRTISLMKKTENPDLF